MHCPHTGPGISLFSSEPGSFGVKRQLESKIQVPGGRLLPACYCFCKGQRWRAAQTLTCTSHWDLKVQTWVQPAGTTSWDGIRGSACLRSFQVMPTLLVHKPHPEPQGPRTTVPKLRQASELQGLFKHLFLSPTFKVSDSGHLG